MTAYSGCCPIGGDRFRTFDGQASQDAVNPRVVGKIELARIVPRTPLESRPKTSSGSPVWIPSNLPSTTTLDRPSHAPPGAPIADRRDIDFEPGPFVRRRRQSQRIRRGAWNHPRRSAGDQLDADRPRREASKPADFVFREIFPAARDARSRQTAHGGEKRDCTQAVTAGAEEQRPFDKERDGRSPREARVHG